MEKKYKEEIEKLKSLNKEYKLTKNRLCHSLWKLDKDKKVGLISEKEYKDVESKIMSISIKGKKVVCRIHNS
jgi:hypothetical protein